MPSSGRAFWMGENNSKWSNWQTTNLKNIQPTYATQVRKNKWPNQTMGQRNRHFSKEDIQMDDKHMKRCLISLIFREMQIKTTMRYHLMLVRVSAIRKSKNNQCWRRCGENATLLPCWWECKLVQPLWRTVFSLKTGNRTAIWPSNPTLGHTHRGNQNWKRHLYPNVHCSTVYSS